MLTKINLFLNATKINLLTGPYIWQVPWSGVITNYSTSPFAEEMFDNLKAILHEYEVVINRWPQYTLILENVSSLPVLVSRFEKLALLHAFMILYL